MQNSRSAPECGATPSSGEQLLHCVFRVLVAVARNVEQRCALSVGKFFDWLQDVERFMLKPAAPITTARMPRRVIDRPTVDSRLDEVQHRWGSLRRVNDFR